MPEKSSYIAPTQMLYQKSSKVQTIDLFAMNNLVVSLMHLVVTLWSIEAAPFETQRAMGWKGARECKASSLL